MIHESDMVFTPATALLEILMEKSVH